MSLCKIKDKEIWNEVNYIAFCRIRALECSKSSKNLIIEHIICWFSWRHYWMSSYFFHVHLINLILDSGVTISFVNMKLGQKSRKDGNIRVCFDQCLKNGWINQIQTWCGIPMSVNTHVLGLVFYCLRYLGRTIRRIEQCFPAP